MSNSKITTVAEAAALAAQCLQDLHNFTVPESGMNTLVAFLRAHTCASAPPQQEPSTKPPDHEGWFWVKVTEKRFEPWEYCPEFDHNFPPGTLFGPEIPQYEPPQPAVVSDEQLAAICADVKRFATSARDKQLLLIIEDYQRLRAERAGGNK